MLRSGNERSHISPRNMRQFKDFDVKDFDQLGRLGIGISPANVRKMMAVMEETGMDAFQPLIGTASIVTPVQFLQNWLPGFVKAITTVREIDTLIGITTVGSWEDEEIVQGFMEPTGTAVPYGDYTNVPLGSWNLNFLTRTIVRFEEGLSVGVLEEARAAKVQISSSDTKRKNASTQLEIQRNYVGFYGYNNGLNLTYGFLNDPYLPSYVTLPNGATSGSPLWSGKTYIDMVNDLKLIMAALRVQAGGNINPNTDNITLAIALGTIDALSTVNTLGSQSVMQWLNATYKNTRVMAIPELTGANGGANAVYAYADTVDDDSTDDSRTFLQAVPAKFKVIGVEQKAKSYLEDYSNATAGAMLKRPFAVVRYSGN